jgi:hypothetical protein
VDNEPQQQEKLERLDFMARLAARSPPGRVGRMSCLSATRRVIRACGPAAVMPGGWLLAAMLEPAGSFGKPSTYYKLVGLLKRHSALTHATFVEQWKSVHAPLFASTPGAGSPRSERNVAR